jgi:Ubiquitin carboxyl-terminal hydrolase
VVCDSCQACSATRDPIEDIGLEVTLPNSQAPPPGSRNSSRNTSPTPATALADVQTAFQRFARAEALDSGYKCEKCGKVGRAKKQSRLASIPPILTLHLKRFRYGDRAAASAPAATRRSCRSEVSQLLGGTDFLSGKSGAAKIEGHIKFDLFFDLKPYLTEELQRRHKNMFCRLFAVIVHAGKNSHSGHYIAYVRNVSKNEWWKMDDSRVMAVTEDEVKAAEAYMLFYRVVQHPVTVRLEELHRKKTLEELSQQIICKKRPYAQIISAESGEEWARKMGFPPEVIACVDKISENISEEVAIEARFYSKLNDEASKHGAAVGKGPSITMSGMLHTLNLIFIDLVHGFVTMLADKLFFD